MTTKMDRRSCRGPAVEYFEKEKKPHVRYPTYKNTNTYKRILMRNRREMAFWGIVMRTTQTCGKRQDGHVGNQFAARRSRLLL